MRNRLLGGVGCYVEKERFIGEEGRERLLVGEGREGF